MQSAPSGPAALAAEARSVASTVPSGLPGSPRRMNAGPLSETRRRKGTAPVEHLWLSANGGSSGRRQPRKASSFYRGSGMVPETPRMLQLHPLEEETPPAQAAGLLESCDCPRRPVWQCRWRWDSWRARLLDFGVWPGWTDCCGPRAWGSA